MSSYFDFRKNDKSHINTLRFVLGLLGSLLVLLTFVLIFMSKEPPAQRLSLPPEIQYGADLKSGEINAWEVYAFTGQLYQLINTWRDNGADDYVNQIGAYSAMMTRRYVAQKHRDYKDKRGAGELMNRLRSVEPLGHYTDKAHCGAYSQECVKSLGNGRWKVWLDVHIKEHQITTQQKSKKPYLVKDIALRIPFIVVYENDDPQYNPWGLKVDREVVDEVTELSLGDRDA